MEFRSLETRLAVWTTPYDSNPVSPANFHARLIWLLAEQTGITAASIAALVESMRLMSRAAFLMHRVVRSDVEVQLRGHAVAAAQLCQLEATWRLATVIPPGHAVWQILRACQLQMADYVVDELAFVCGYRDARSLDRGAAIDLAVAKHGLARVCPYLLGALDERFEPKRFEPPIRHICLAVQALDDARRWRSDATHGRPSLVLAGTPPELELSAPNGMRALQRWLIASGHLRSVVEFAAEQVDLVRGVTGDAPASRLTAMLGNLQTRIAAIRELLPT